MEMGDCNMRKKMGLFVMVASISLLVACGTEPTSPPPAEPATGLVAVTEATVTLSNLAFQPHTLVVATGAEITWQNDDAEAHTVTSGEGWFDSAQLATGQSFSHQFSQPGTFR